MLLLTGIDGDIEEFGYEHLVNGLVSDVDLLERFDEEERTAIGVGQPFDVDEDLVAQIMQVEFVGDVLDQRQENIDRILIHHGSDNSSTSCRVVYTSKIAREKLPLSSQAAAHFIHSKSPPLCYYGNDYWSRLY